MSDRPRTIYLDFDGAWAGFETGLPRVDATGWGPRLRFSASPRTIEHFYREMEPRLADFVLYGSGDFHHLTGLLLRRVREPVTLVALDNHPDWDVRPPRWCCGSWVNRALELPRVQHIAIWGCGNFECWWPHQLFGNRKAERAGKLEVHPWADDRPLKDRNRRGAILREDWRARFHKSVEDLAGRAIYITVDLDCLAPTVSWTNWENGKFTIEDVIWILGLLRQHARIVGGDLCGGYSPGVFARRKQRFASKMDHPRIEFASQETIRAVNQAAFAAIWPALTQGNEYDSGTDQSSAKKQARS